MNTAAATKFFSIFSPTRITGPIFEKELRVSSRRKRTYLLRFIYVLSLMVFIGVVWSKNISYMLDHLYTASYMEQMAAAGKLIIMYISWFQFFTMPVLAVILLSSSISSEVQGKTIGVLVSTPITSFQIVMGKMLSKLYQLILLMAISVPILSMVRVFGGVQWSYIISTFCVTLTLTIFAGSLSLFLSIYIKKPFVVIPLSVGLILIVLMLEGWYGYEIYDSDSIVIEFILAIFNPYIIIMEIVEGIKYSPVNIEFWAWLSNCCLMLLFSGIILLIASLKVRKVALMQVTGQLSPLRRWLNTESKNAASKTVNPKKQKKIRNVSDNPVIWREARSPIFVKRKFLRIAAIVLVSLGSAAIFFTCISATILSNGESLATCILGFMIYGTIFTVIFPASCIPAEKESRSWPMLMSTSLTDWQILTGKFVGILRKCMLPWSLLLLFILYILVLGLTHPITILFITLNMISVIALLSGSGLFFGTLFRKTNAAVIANIIFAVGIWILLPMLSDFRLFILGDFFDFCFAMNPFYESTLVVDLRAYTNLIYRWPSERLGAGMTLVTITISTLIHISIGAFFIICAKKRLRKNIF